MKVGDVLVNDNARHHGTVVDKEKLGGRAFVYVRWSQGNVVRHYSVDTLIDFGWRVKGKGCVFVENN